MAARSMHDWRAELVESYADLFRPAGDPLGAEGWPNVGEGWRDLLERACGRIRDAVRADGGSFKATQIKEKYGSLRFYWSGRLSSEAVAKVEEAVDLAEARSAVTCEVCGEEGRLRRGRWMTTRCDAHSEGRPPAAAGTGEAIHVARRFAFGKPVVRRRRYERGTDSFIDVGPSPSEEA